MSTAPLLQAVLGPEDRAELARDLQALADVREVMIDDANGTRTCRLDEAFAAIEAGAARRVRLRYRFQGTTWCDTLVVAQDAVRLVRVDESDLAGGDEGPLDRSGPSVGASPAG